MLIFKGFFFVFFISFRFVFFIFRSFFDSNVVYVLLNTIYFYYYKRHNRPAGGGRRRQCNGVGGEVMLWQFIFPHNLSFLLLLFLLIINECDKEINLKYTFDSDRSPRVYPAGQLAMMPFFLQCIHSQCELLCSFLLFHPPPGKRREMVKQENHWNDL